MTTKTANALADRVDRMGELKAQIAALQTEYDDIKAGLVERMQAEGLDAYEGDMFRANLSVIAPSEVLDTAKAREYLEEQLTPRQFQKYMKEKAGSLRVLVTARNGDE